MYKLLNDIYDDEMLKHSFNELTQQVFHFSFQDWDENGFWTNQFRPYVIVEDGKVVSNVSVNDMTFLLDDERKHYIQLGTVMTDKDYRKQGLGRRIMECVINEYKDKADAIFLIANDRVLDYYPKFGFQVATEYEYYKRMDCSHNQMLARKVDMSIRENVSTYINAYNARAINERFSMIENNGIVGFYATKAMPNNFYYIEEEKTYAVAEIEEGKLVLHFVVADHRVNLDHVIAAFGSEIQEVVLMFTPLETGEYQQTIHKEEDSTLFYIGKKFEEVEQKRLMIPTIAHT